MQDYESKPRGRMLGVKLALIGGGVAAGAITATALGANAATVGSGTTAASTRSTSTSTSQPANDHGSRPVRGDEKSLDSATAAKLKAAALKAVPGGTVYRVEKDSGDATYEAHMTKSDGTEVTAKFDKNLAVTGVESGMGK